MENIDWVSIVKIEPDGEEDCLCIAVSHPSRLYVTENGIVTHNTTVDGEGEGVFNASNGSTRQRITTGTTRATETPMERDAAASDARGLLGALETLAASLPQVRVSRSSASSRSSGNPRIDVGFSGSGEITLNSVEFGAWWERQLAANGDSAGQTLAHSAAVVAEERWHLAQLVAMRNDWLSLSPSSRGSFVEYVAARSRELMMDVSAQMSRMSAEEQSMVKQSLHDVWALYFGEGNPHKLGPEGLWNQFQQSTTGELANPSFVAEWLRNLQQMRQRGVTSETAGLISRLVEWVRTALDNLRQVAGMAAGGKLGKATQELMSRMEAVLDGREAVSDFTPSPRFAGQSGRFAQSNLGTTYRTLPNAVLELQEGMEWARSTRDERSVDGETVPDTAYDVRTDLAMRDASEAVMDSLNAEGLRGDALMQALRNRNLGGQRLDLDERQILIRHMIQTGRFHEFGVTRRQLMTLMQEGAGKGAMAMREMREVLDPIERLRQEAETRTHETVQRVTGQDAEALQAQMETEVMAAQETAVNEELEKLRAEASDLRKALDQHKADLAESRQNASKERLQREAEVKRLQNLLNLTEQKLAELEARPADSAEANERLAEEVLKARERAAELRREIRDLETALAEEQARADQQLEVGVAIGREEGRAEADAEWAARQPEAQLERFEQWLMGEQIDGIERVETFARRYLQASRFDAEGFGQAVAALFPAVDPHILEDAMDRVAVSLSNSAAVARRREIQNFVDRLAGRVKKPQDQERLGRFLGSLQRASDFGILDADVFTDAFAHAFELNGMTPAVAQQLLNQWHDINRLDGNGKRVHFGMVRETLEREFLEAVNAVAPGARWDNFIFNQYQSAVLSSISSGINQFSGIFRSLSGIDAVARLAARGNYNPADMMAEWWRNVSDLFSNLPFVLTGLRGESLGHMGAQVRGNFTPQEQQLQFARNQQVRMRLPGGRTVTLPNGAAKLLRLKELWSWRIIRAAEGLSGITDAQARFRDTLAAHYQASGMSAGQARARALSDIASSPADRAAAEAQARAEQAAGKIGRGQTVVRRRVEEIIQNKIDLRANEELTARAEHLTAAAQFKTMPTGALGYMIASTFKAMTNPNEGGGRVARFMFLFGRFMGHTVDVTLGYMPIAHWATLGREKGTTRRHEVIKEVYGSVEAYNNQQRGKAIAGGSFMVATAALQALAAAMGDDDEEPFFAITGFAPTADPAAKERLKATGQWDEGQIRIGGRPIINYSQLPELVPLLTILGNVSDYLRYDSALYRRAAGEGEAGSQAMSGGEVTGAVAGDVLLAPLKRSTYKQWVAALDSLMKGRVTDSISNIATTPLGGALRVPVLVDADKVAREIDGARDAKGLVENTLRRIPFVTIGEKMYNPYGEQLPGFDVLGMFPSGPKASPEVQRAAALNLDTRTTRGVPQLNLKYEDGTVREATAEERERYIETSGRYFVQAMLENETAVRQAYAEGGQAAAQKIVGKLSSKANAQAKEEVVK
jgi:hypothetical protein